jgi:hypothetical protein
MRLGRLERLVVAALTVIGPEASPGLAALGRDDPPSRGAVAWCLERAAPGDARPAILACDDAPGEGPTAWAAPSLLAASALLEREPGTVHEARTRDAWSGLDARLVVRAGRLA